jgi:hypothetical protein
MLVGRQVLSNSGIYLPHLLLVWTALQRVAATLRKGFNCAPVFIDPEIKQKYYKGKTRAAAGAAAAAAAGAAAMMTGAAEGRMCSPMVHTAVRRWWRL